MEMTPACVTVDHEKARATTMILVENGDRDNEAQGSNQKRTSNIETATTARSLAW